MATGEVLVFVDSDVRVHADAFSRIRKRFDGDPRLMAVFGSYDDSPAEAGIVSAFRNLLHHHVHQQGAGPATTFWTGIGAVQRAEFVALGGFDERRFTSSSIEDIELGMRLTAANHRIELDPSIQGTYLKHWTLGEMLYTDVFRRGVPWVALLLGSGSGSATLNLGWRHRLSAAGSLTAVGAVAARRVKIAAAALLALVALNAPFYRLLLRRQGPFRAAVGIGLHVLHHLAAVTAVPLGVLSHFRDTARTGRRRSMGRY